MGGECQAALPAPAQPVAVLYLQQWGEAAGSVTPASTKQFDSWTPPSSDSISWIALKAYWHVFRFCYHDYEVFWCTF